MTPASVAAASSDRVTNGCSTSIATVPGVTVSWVLPISGASSPAASRAGTGMPSTSVQKSPSHDEKLVPAAAAKSAHVS